MKVKIVHLLLISNVLAAVIGGITFGVIANSSAIMFSMCAVGVIVATAGLSIFIARQISVGLQTLEKSVATAHGGDPLSIHELESTRIKIQQYVQRWSVAAKRSRTQNKVIDWMVETLESRALCTGNPRGAREKNL